VRKGFEARLVFEAHFHSSADVLKSHRDVNFPTPGASAFVCWHRTARFGHIIRRATGERQW